MKRAIIIHCWGGSPDYCWYPRTKADLAAEGITTAVPAMPNTDEPALATWLPALKAAIGVPDEEMVLIGHSVGCITILRYLEQLPPDQRVKGLVLVAGYTHDLGFAELKSFFSTPINFELIQEKTEHIVAIASDNDPYVPVDQGEIFRQKLGAHLIVKHHMGHFSGPKDDEVLCIVLPDVTKSVLKIFSH